MNHSANQQKPTLVPKKRLSRKKWWIIGAVVVVVLLGGVASAWFVMSHKKATSSPPLSTKQAAVKRNEQVKQTADQAQQQAAKGDVAQAKATYDGAIKSTSDLTQKSQLLYSKALLLYISNDQAGALSVAKEADATQSSRATADFLAQMYQVRGDKQNAVVYYQKALSMVNKSSPQADRDIKKYQALIAALSGSKS